MNGMTRGLARLIGANQMRASQKLRAPALLRACALTSSLSCVTIAVYHVEAQPSTSKPRAKTSLTHPAVVSQQGVWVQDMSASESLSPFLRGLGVPWFVCPVVDKVKTTLRIELVESGALQIVDKTIFGRNATEVVLGGLEVKTLTRNGRKSFMLSAWIDDACVIIRCRLHERGDGWETRQERFVRPTDGVLVERNVLVRPGEAEVVVLRYFRKTDETIGGA